MWHVFVCVIEEVTPNSGMRNTAYCRFVVVVSISLHRAQMAQQVLHLPASRNKHGLLSSGLTFG